MNFESQEIGLPKEEMDEHEEEEAQDLFQNLDLTREIKEMKVTLHVAKTALKAQINKTNNILSELEELRESIKEMKQND